MSTPLDARVHFVNWLSLVRQPSFAVDTHLQSLVRHYQRPELVDALTAFGDQFAEVDDLARESNRDENLPKLRRWDGIGRRTEGIDFHPSYHALGRRAYATGAMSRYSSPGQEFETLALTYQLAQHGEAGHTCPFACTAGMIKIAQLATGLPPEWLERLLDPNYDTHFHGAQFLTEVQGGSDVGANALVAKQDGAEWTLHGEKWFCSVADAQLFLVTARPEGAANGTRGVTAFIVPRNLADGSVNHFTLRRLKYKLGTRSMASSEIDFNGARAWPVGDFRRVVEVVLNTSRLYNATCSAGMMQRAYREADSYARTRIAFGAPILQFAGIAATVARLRTEAYAARASTFLLVDLADQIAKGTASEADQQAWRMLVNLNKYWTAYIGTGAIRDAIEVLGGNGAIEEFTVLPRLLRDSIVCEAWEGGHNILCAQALRDSQRLGLHKPMFDWLERLAGGPVAELDAVKRRWESLLAMPEAEASAYVRAVAEDLRPVVQAIALRAEARTAGSDPALGVIADHLLATNARAWDPLTDSEYRARIAAIVA